MNYEIYFWIFFDYPWFECSFDNSRHHGTEVGFRMPFSVHHFDGGPLLGSLITI